MGPHTADQSSEGLVDRAAILERFDGDVDLLQEVAVLFLEDCPRRLAAIQEAVVHGDRQELQNAAHSVKGSVSNFAAPLAVEAALRLELIARQGDMAQASNACASLEQIIARLTPVLAELARGCAA